MPTTRLSTLALATLVHISTSLHAQITLTATDLPQLGLTVTAYGDPSSGSAFIPTPASAEAQHWDYRNAAADDTVSWTLTAPDGLWGSEALPTAELAKHIVYVEDSYTATVTDFYRTDATGLYSVGQAEQVPDEFDILETRTNDLELPVPFTYGDSIATAYLLVNLYTSLLPNGPLNLYHIHGKRAFVADAWGTMRTPAFPEAFPVLRVWSPNLEHQDTMWVDATGTGEHYELEHTFSFGMGAQHAWNFYRTAEDGLAHVFYKFYDLAHPGIGETTYYGGGLSTGVRDDAAANTSVPVYPNPVVDRTLVLHVPAGMRTVRVLNAQGTCVRALNVAGIQTLQLDLRDAAAGMYVVRWEDAQGQAKGCSKVLVP